MMVGYKGLEPPLLKKADDIRHHLTFSRNGGFPLARDVTSPCIPTSPCWTLVAAPYPGWPVFLLWPWLMATYSKTVGFFFSDIQGPTFSCSNQIHWGPTQLGCLDFISRLILDNPAIAKNSRAWPHSKNWLVLDLPLWKIWYSQLG